MVQQKKEKKNALHILKFPPILHLKLGEADRMSGIHTPCSTTSSRNEIYIIFGNTVDDS